MTRASVAAAAVLGSAIVTAAALIGVSVATATPPSAAFDPAPSRVHSAGATITMMPPHTPIIKGAMMNRDRRNRHRGANHGFWSSAAADAAAAVSYEASGRAVATYHLEN
jgi:hypothetical protein